MQPWGDHMGCWTKTQLSMYKQAPSHCNCSSPTFFYEVTSNSALKMNCTFFSYFLCNLFLHMVLALLQPSLYLVLLSIESSALNLSISSCYEYEYLCNSSQIFLYIISVIQNFVIRQSFCLFCDYHVFPVDGIVQLLKKKQYSPATQK